MQRLLQVVISGSLLMTFGCKNQTPQQTRTKADEAVSGGTASENQFSDEFKRTGEGDKAGFRARLLGAKSRDELRSVFDDYDGRYDKLPAEAADVRLVIALLSPMRQLEGIVFR